MVVVRNHDFALWVVTKSESDRSFNGDSDSDDFTDIHISFVYELQRIDPGRERDGGEPAEKGEVGRHYRLGLQLHAGVFGADVRRHGEERMGEYVHARYGDRRLDVNGSPDYRSLRARKLPADDGVRRAERDCSAESWRQHQPRLLLPGRDAGCRRARVLRRVRLSGFVARALSRAGFMRGDHAGGFESNGLGARSSASQAADFRLAGYR